MGNRGAEDLDFRRTIRNWIFVLCRTDKEAPKHRGISFLLCPVDQEGVEMRPIEMLSGESDFNETFLPTPEPVKKMLSVKLMVVGQLR